ncbi:hypothetical protein GGI00_004099, partial [Coemansia sp. RSA 2681]
AVPYETNEGLLVDPLVLRNDFEDKIVAELFRVLAKYKQDALAELLNNPPTASMSTLEH